MGFSRQEYWGGMPFPPLGDLPDPGIEPVSLRLLHWEVDFFFLPLHHLGNPHTTLDLSQKAIICNVYESPHGVGATVLSTHPRSRL